MVATTGVTYPSGVAVEGAVRVCITPPADDVVHPTGEPGGDSVLIERFLAWQVAEQVTPYTGGEVGPARLVQTFPETHAGAIKEFFAVPPVAVLDGPAVDFLASLAARIDAGEARQALFDAVAAESAPALAGALAGWLQTHPEPAVAAQKVYWPDEPPGGEAQLWLAARILGDADLDLPTAARWLRWMHPAVRGLLIVSADGFADRRVLRVFHELHRPS